jgi:flagellar basal body-associated protein FliL
MSDEQAQPAETTTKKKAPMKVVILVAALMLVEGIAVFGFIAMSGFGAAKLSADELEGQAVADLERPVEIQLIEGKFQNRSTGRPWTWHTQLYLQVRNKNVEHVEKVLEQRENEIKEGIRLIISKAQDRHLKEPGGETIRRQLTTYINTVFGADPDGEHRVEKLLISRFDGFPAD